MKQVITITKRTPNIFTLSDEAQPPRVLYINELKLVYGIEFAEWLERLEPFAFPVEVEVTVTEIKVRVEQTHHQLTLEHDQPV